MARVKKESTAPSVEGATDPNVGQPQTLADVATTITDEAAQALASHSAFMTGAGAAQKSLVEVLGEADRASQVATAREVVFESAHRRDITPIDPRFDSIVEKVFAPLDFAVEYDAIEKWMSLGSQRTEEAFIRKAHEEGPAILRKASRMYLQAKLVRETWESQNEVVFGAMRDAATKALETEREKKIRTKTITEADVDATCARLFPDQYSVQEAKRRKFKLTEDSLQRLVDETGTRWKTLDTMMHKLR